MNRNWGLALVFAAASFGASSADPVVGLGADVTSLDLHALNAVPNNSIAEHIFDTLVQAGEVRLMEVIPPQDFVKIKANNALNIFTISSSRMIFFHLDSDRDKTPFAFDKNPFKDVIHALFRSSNLDPQP